MSLNKITADEIAAKSVAGLANRPNAAARYGTGGMSAEEYKNRFDALAKLAIDRLNMVIDTINSESTSADAIAKLIQTPIERGVGEGEYLSLYDVLVDILDGEFAGYLNLNGLEKANLQDELADIEANVDDIQTDVSEINNTIGDTADEAKADGSVFARLAKHTSDISANATAISTLDGNKVNKSDIVDNLTTGGSAKVLSAQQGKALNERLTTAETDIDNLEVKVGASTDPASSSGTLYSRAKFNYDQSTENKTVIGNESTSATLLYRIKQLETLLSVLAADLDAAEAILEARQQPIAVDTTEYLSEWLQGTAGYTVTVDGNPFTPSDLITGTVILIRATSEPDYWWDGGISSAGTVEVNGEEYISTAIVGGVVIGGVRELEYNFSEVSAAVESAESAQSAAEEAQTNSETARAEARKWADGTGAISTDPQYENNAKFYAAGAEESATVAAGSATASEGARDDSQTARDEARKWADGTGAIPGDPQYQNNAKYYAESYANTRRYTARWNKTDASMSRLNDAAKITTNTTNFTHNGSVNPNYNNPFDDIYPWSGVKLCNIDIDRYAALSPGQSLRDCVKAWEGDTDFSYADVNGVWDYTPEFYGKSWDDGTYRYFDVSDKVVGGHVHYPESIEGRWHGRSVTLTVEDAPKTCLVPSIGMPAKNTAMSTLHTYAKNYGATLDSIFSIDASSLLLIVEFATINTQNAIGNGVSNMYRQSSDFIQAAATESPIVKVLKSAGLAFCLPGAIFDIGTSDGGRQVGSYLIVSATEDGEDESILNVTLDEPVTVTTAHYWSIHGIANAADEQIGSKSGYIGTNGKCNAYYRGKVLFGNMWFYILGAYRQAGTQRVFIANNEAEADAVDALNAEVHYDTGITLSQAAGYVGELGMLSRSGLLAIPPFCTAIGGTSASPVGDYHYITPEANNTVLLRGGRAPSGASGGAFCGGWGYSASSSYWACSARPRLKSP